MVTKRELSDLHLRPTKDIRLREKNGEKVWGYEDDDGILWIACLTGTLQRAPVMQKIERKKEKPDSLEPVFFEAFDRYFLYLYRLKSLKQMQIPDFLTRKILLSKFLGVRETKREATGKNILYDREEDCLYIMSSGESCETESAGEELLIRDITGNPDESEYAIPDIMFNKRDSGNPNQKLYKICGKSQQWFVPVVFEKDSAKMGVWLSFIPKTVIAQLMEYIFSEQKNIRRIRYQNYLYKLGAAVFSPQYVIHLPETVEKLEARLSAKSRYNLKREKRLIREKIGNYQVKHYSSGQIQTDLVEQYFKFKNLTHKRDYGLTEEQYLRQYRITDCYSMETDTQILAILFSCEQGEMIFFENFSYDVKFSGFSLGQVMYDHFLEAEVMRKRKYLSLGGGDYEYKKKYKSICIPAYTGTVYRSKYLTLIHKFKIRLKIIIIKILH